nr:ATP-binding protein [Anabaena sp. 49628_E55]
MQIRETPFTKDRDNFLPLMMTERLLMGTLAITAIAGTFSPVLFSYQNNSVKLVQQIFGLFSGICFTGESYRRKQKEKFYNSIEQANLAIVNNQLKGSFAFEQCRTQIDSKRELASYVNLLPEIERPRWTQEFGLHGLVELPQVQQAVLEQPKHLPGSRNIPNPEVATIDEQSVQAIINPSVRQLLQELASQYPEYVRIDDFWVDELCESSARQNMSDRANHHFSFWGETQSGKSTLAGVFINKIIAESGKPAIVIGSDPKNFLTAWLCKFSRKFDGFKTNLDQWVTYATSVIDARQNEFNNNR